MDVSENSGFSPQTIRFNRVFHYEPSILGRPYFWKHPYGGFLKCWVSPTTIGGVPTKNDQHLGWRLGGNHHFSGNTHIIQPNAGKLPVPWIL